MLLWVCDFSIEMLSDDEVDRHLIEARMNMEAKDFLLIEPTDAYADRFSGMTIDKSDKKFTLAFGSPSNYYPESLLTRPSKRLLIFSHGRDLIFWDLNRFEVCKKQYVSDLVQAICDINDKNCSNTDNFLVICETSLHIYNDTGSIVKEVFFEDIVCSFRYEGILLTLEFLDSNAITYEVSSYGLEKTLA